MMNIHVYLIIFIILSRIVTTTKTDEEVDVEDDGYFFKSKVTEKDPEGFENGDATLTADVKSLIAYGIFDPEYIHFGLKNFYLSDFAASDNPNVLKIQVDRSIMEFQFFKKTEEVQADLKMDENEIITVRPSIKQNDHLDVYILQNSEIQVTGYNASTVSLKKLKLLSAEGERKAVKMTFDGSGLKNAKLELFFRTPIGKYQWMIGGLKAKYLFMIIGGFAIVSVIVAVVICFLNPKCLLPKLWSWIRQKKNGNGLKKGNKDNKGGVTTENKVNDTTRGTERVESRTVIDKKDKEDVTDSRPPTPELGSPFPFPMTVEEVIVPVEHQVSDINVTVEDKKEATKCEDKAEKKSEEQKEKKRGSSAKKTVEEKTVEHSQVTKEQNKSVSQDQTREISVEQKGKKPRKNIKSESTKDVTTVTKEEKSVLVPTKMVIRNDDEIEKLVEEKKRKMDLAKAKKMI